MASYLSRILPRVHLRIKLRLRLHLRLPWTCRLTWFLLPTDLRGHLPGSGMFFIVFSISISFARSILRFRNKIIKIKYLLTSSQSRLPSMASYLSRTLLRVHLRIKLRLRLHLRLPRTCRLTWFLLPTDLRGHLPGSGMFFIVFSIVISFARSTLCLWNKIIKIKY